MTEIEKARREIDEIDAEMVRLFCRRMRAVREIAAWKAANGSPVTDKGREAEVIARGCAALDDPALTDECTAFLRTMIGLSKDYQRRMLGEAEACSGKQLP